MHNDIPNTILSLSEKIIRQHNSGISEYELIKLLDKKLTWSDTFSSDPNLQIFQKHFILMNALYTLQEKFSIQAQEQIIINPICIEIRPLSSPRTETYPSEESCNIKLKEYYLDWKFFEDASEESVNTLLTQFWLKYQRIDQKDAALLRLELSAEASQKQIKEQYKKLAHQHHPDKGGDADVFVQIQHAWEVLRS